MANLAENSLESWKLKNKRGTTDTKQEEEPLKIEKNSHESASKIS